MRRLLLRQLAAVTLAVGLVGLLAAPASAHGDLVDGSPGPGDVVATGTTLVRLEFTALDLDGAPLVAVRGPSGDPVAVGEAGFGDSTTICARSAPLEEGVNTVDYSVLSDDGDRQTGSYTFEVSASGEGVEPAACDAAALAEPGEAQTLEEMGSGTVPTIVLYGLGVLAVLAMGLLVMRVRADRRADPSPRGESLTTDWPARAPRRAACARARAPWRRAPGSPPG